MGFRFRRSFKILPGIRWNISKTGTSWSFCGRGYTMNVRRGRLTRTLGIPGTGLSHRQVVSGRSGQHELSLPSSATPSVPVEPRFGIPVANPHRRNWFLGAILTLPFGLLFPPIWLGTVLVFVVAALQPTGAQLIQRELTRRQTTWQHYLDETRNNTTKDSPTLALARLRELELTDLEAGPMVPILEAFREFYAFERECDGRLMPIAGYDEAVGDERCYFASEAIYDKRGNNDPNGMLYLTATRVLFGGEARLSIPWKKIVSVSQEHGSLRLQRDDRENPTVFSCPSLAGALKAEWIANNIRANLVAES